jgi:hypothetical protein
LPCWSAEDLDLDVARLLDVLLEVDRRVLERLLGLGARRVVAGDEARLVVRDAHAAATAAGRGLDQHREADLARDRERVLFVLDRAVGTGHARHAGFLGQALGRDLVAAGCAIVSATGR